MREVRVSRIAGKRAPKDTQPLAGRHAAARLVSERHDAVDVGELSQRFVT